MAELKLLINKNLNQMFVLMIFKTENDFNQNNGAIAATWSFAEEEIAEAIETVAEQHLKEGNIFQYEIYEK